MRHSFHGCMVRVPLASLSAHWCGFGPRVALRSLSPHPVLSLPSKHMSSTTVRFALQAHKGPAHVARYSSDGTYCVSGGADKLVRLWNADKGTFVATYDGHGWEVLDLCM